MTKYLIISMAFFVSGFALAELSVEQLEENLANACEFANDPGACEDKLMSDYELSLEKLPGILTGTPVCAGLCCGYKDQTECPYSPSYKYRPQIVPPNTSNNPLLIGGAVAGASK